VGPCYGFFGAGLALYFASQGAGRLLWPLLAGFARLAVAAAGGWLVSAWLGAGLPGLFFAMASALVIFGTINVAAVHLGAWRAGSRRTS
jgi:Na+-driven multidrug efflux pump